MIRFKTSSEEVSQADRPNAGTDSGDGLLRTALLALAVGAVIYFLLRRRRSAEPNLPIDEVRETAEEVLEGGREIPIGDPIREDLEAEDAVAEPDVNDADLDEQPSAEEVEERVEEDVQERPAEPGEMTIDEDVAEEVIEDDDAVDEAEAGDALEDPDAGEESDTDEANENGDNSAERN